MKKRIISGLLIGLILFNLTTNDIVSLADETSDISETISIENNNPEEKSEEESSGNAGSSNDDVNKDESSNASNSNLGEEQKPAAEDGKTNENIEAAEGEQTDMNNVVTAVEEIDEEQKEASEEKSDEIKEVAAEEEKTDAKEAVAEEQESKEAALEGETTDESVETDDEADSSEKKVAFEKSKDIGGVNISMKASEGVLPEGADFESEKITDDESLNKIEELISSQLGSSKNVTVLDVFDITLYNGDESNTVTFDGTVDVTFTKDYSSENIEIVYVSDNRDAIEEYDCTVKDGKVTFSANHFSTYAVVSIEDNAADSTQEIDETALVESVSYTVNGEEITENSEVSLNDKFGVTYTFNSPIYLNYDDDSQEEGNIYISSGNTYKLPGIDATAFDLSSIGSITVYLNDGSTVLGTATVDTDGTVTLYITCESILEIYDLTLSFEFGLNTDSDSIKNAQTYELAIPGTDTSVTLSISENQPQAPTVTKTASSIDDDDNITWTVTITNDANPITYDNGYTFIDTFSDNQSYVEGSFAVNSTAVTDNLTVDTTDGTLTYTFTNNEADSITYITYKTHVDFITAGSTQNGNISLTVTNNANLYDTDDTTTAIASASVEKEVSKTLSSWISKSGGSLDSDGIAEWQITVDTNGYSMRNLTVYDVLSTDTSTTMNLLPDTIVVTDTVNGTETTLTAETDYEIVTTAGTSENGKAYTWYLRFIGTDYVVSGDHTYTITYSTQIEDYTSFLQTNHTTIPSNYAFLEYEYYYTGTGSWVLLAGPTLDKIGVSGTGVTTKAAIEKSCVSFNPATQEITWQVVANKNYQKITNATVTELIGDGQEFVSVSDATLTDGTNSSTYEINTSNYSKDSSGNIVIDFGDSLNGYQATFTVITKLIGDEYVTWAANSSKKYSNTVQLDSDQQTEITDTASCTYKSTVLEKSAVSYNYDTHEIDYKITVNRNEMAMTSIVVTDDLDAIGLSLVEGTVEVDGTAITTDTSTKPYYTYTDGILTVYLADTSESDIGTEAAIETITFTAKVNDGDIYTSTNNAAVSVTNTATLTTDENPDGVSVSKQLSWVNSVIKKTAAVDTDTKVITYTVTFNGNRQVLPTNLILRDTLGADLDLDTNSVKLYLGEINATTGEVTATSEEATDYSVSVGADGDNTVLDVTLPQIENNTNIYVLTYTATPTSISSSGDYSNSITLLGYTSEDSNSSTANLSYSSFGGGWTVSPVILQVTNQDAEDEGVTLAGTTFIITDTDGNTVAQVTTKTSGTVKSVGKLATSTTYYLSEATTPDGYQESDEIIEFTTASSGGSDNATEIVFTNTKLKKDIDISKVDGTGNLLSGANLSVSWVNSSNETVEADTWTSTDETHSFSASYETVYTLTETAAPFGYEISDSIIFKVVDDVLYIYTGETENPWVETDAISMVDVALDTCGFTVDKVSSSNISLEGASLLISENEDGTDPVISWDTDGSSKEIALPAGEYYLIETEAPAGYTVASTIKFRITDNLTLEIYNEESEEYVSSEDSTITMIDEYDETETVTLTLSASSLGLDSTLFSSMLLSLYSFNLDEGTLELLEADSEEENTYTLNYQEEYVLQTSLIDDEESTQQVTFKIVDEETDSDGVTTYTIKVKNEDGSYETVSMTELGSKVTPVLKEEAPVVDDPEEEDPEEEDPEVENSEDDPKEEIDEPSQTENNQNTTPTETPLIEDVALVDSQETEELEETEEEASAVVQAAQSSSNSNNISYSSNYSTESADEEYMYKSNDITATADGDENSESGAKLAKTGGFIGTIMGYIAGIAFILLGLFMFFGKKKEYDK